MQCGDYSPRRKSHPAVKPSRSLLVDRNISTSAEASREKKPNRQTHHSDSQFLQNDPLKHRRVSSLSKHHLSARVLYKAERGMNECVWGTQHWQWLYTTPTTASIKNRKLKSRFRSVWDIFFPRVPAHMLASLIHFYCHYMFRKDVQYIHFCLSKKQTA